LSIKGLILNQWQQAGALFINEGKNIFITFLAASSVINGNLTLGGMLAVQYIIGQLNSPVEQLIQFIQHWQQAKISIERLNEIHGVADEEPFGNELLQQLPLSFARAIVGGRSPQADYKSEVLPFEITNPDQQQFPTIKETEGWLDQVGISFKNLTFTYPGAGNSPVLKDINLTVPKGKVTAIVGMSGSGKTTLLKLLLKFYDAQKGDIKIGESSLMSISHKIWRQHCGVVMQESYIFSDTIAKNIAVGDERINQSQLRYALQVANIEEFIDTLPLGLQTKIGQEGVGLSMGQKQRILIARAVYRDPELILLDEATNSLDANNEKVILDNLNQFFKGRTVVVVAHRLSTVKNADQIVVLDRGEIAERGTHEDLINLRGDYYHLIKNQLELGN
jgi:ATP-binding cassette, subfamily B, bacterial